MSAGELAAPVCKIFQMSVFFRKGNTRKVAFEKFGEALSIRWCIKDGIDVAEYVFRGNMGRVAIVDIPAKLEERFSMRWAFSNGSRSRNISKTCLLAFSCFSGA